MDRFKLFFEKHKDKIKGKYLFIIGLVGIGLVFLSTVIPSANKGGNSASSAIQTDVKAELEEKIAAVASEIACTDDVSVMITLESDGRTIYAEQLTSSANITENDTSGGTKTQTDENTKNDYIIIENASGDQQALVVTKLAPIVNGVVIIVSGQSGADVSDKIQQAVTTVLNIPKQKVCVITK